MVNLNKLLTKGKAIFLAYDQGLEHGPTDFKDKNVDPSYIIEIAKKTKVNAVVFHKGIAEKYSSEIKKSKIPLIVKLNGKSNIYKGEPCSYQITSVKEAKKLGASGVGYTVYLGSKYENKMLTEFGKIVEEAHKANLVVVAWIYPRGKDTEKISKKDLMAYSARMGLETGADIVKIIPNENLEDMKWAVKSAGKTKVVFSGGSKKGESVFLNEIKKGIDAGACGFAIGRNIWQSDDPINLVKKIKKIMKI